MGERILGLIVYNILDKAIALAIMEAINSNSTVRVWIIHLFFFIEIRLNVSIETGDWTFPKFLFRSCVFYY